MFVEQPLALPGSAKKALQLTAAREVYSYQSFYWSTTKLLSTCGWLSVNQVYWQGVYTTTHDIILSQKPFYGRMVARHKHHTRAAAGVSRGCGNLIVSTSFNHAATSYNRLI